LKISDHFTLEEYIPPEIFKLAGEKAVSFISERLILGNEKLRRTLGKSITINNWKSGGDFKNSGLRSWSCKEGAKFSDHKYGHATDLKVDGMHSFEVQKFLADHWLEYNMFFTAIEKGTDGWTHVSDRYIPGWDKSKPFWIPIQ